MTDIDLDALDALAAAATPGPWFADSTEIGRTYGDDPTGLIETWVAESCDIDNPEQGAANAAFIAAARDAVPALTARVRELEAAHVERNAL
jgi:hypothetical protein